MNSHTSTKLDHAVMRLKFIYPLIQELKSYFSPFDNQHITTSYNKLIIDYDKFKEEKDTIRLSQAADILFKTIMLTLNDLLTTFLKNHIQYDELEENCAALSMFPAFLETRPNLEPTDYFADIFYHKSFIYKISHLIKKAIEEKNFNEKNQEKTLIQKFEIIKSLMINERYMEEKKLALAIEKLSRNKKAIELAYQSSLEAPGKRVLVYNTPEKVQDTLKKLSQSALTNLNQLGDNLTNAHKTKNYKASIESLKTLPKDIRKALHLYPTLLSKETLTQAMRESNDFRLARMYGNEEKPTKKMNSLYLLKIS